MSDPIKVTFGIIVLNGEPFIQYNLRALYPFAYQIIVVEGAAPAAAGIASPNGHSTDGTLETLLAFKEHDDPEGKLTILTAEDVGHPNGFWPGEKDEQSRAFAAEARGTHLWQVDVDEFYRPDDMAAVLEMLRRDSTITAVSFEQITFWGWFDYVAEGWYFRLGWCANGIHRVFKWAPGYQYVSHRPPTVLNERGEDLRGLKWVRGKTLARKGIFMAHYSLLFPKQVFDKCEYYSAADWSGSGQAKRWAEDCFWRLRDPYHVHNVCTYPSWLERFMGEHPPQIELMRRDLMAGRLGVAIRPRDDIERLLNSPVYMLGRMILKILQPLVLFWHGPMQSWLRFLRLLGRDPVGMKHK
jgi:hypothetical protein